MPQVIKHEYNTAHDSKNWWSVSISVHTLSCYIMVQNQATATVVQRDTKHFMQSQQQNHKLRAQRHKQIEFKT
jgi:hypothetical protein